jgi:hypothetical protein
LNQLCTQYVTVFGLSASEDQIITQSSQKISQQSAFITNPDVFINVLMQLFQIKHFSKGFDGSFQLNALAETLLLLREGTRSTFHGSTKKM